MANYIGTGTSHDSSDIEAEICYCQRNEVYVLTIGSYSLYTYRLHSITTNSVAKYLNIPFELIKHNVTQLQVMMFTILNYCIRIDALLCFTCV